jgi:hypothetical protein
LEWFFQHAKRLALNGAKASAAGNPNANVDFMPTDEYLIRYGMFCDPLIFPSSFFASPLPLLLHFVTCDVCAVRGAWWLVSVFANESGLLCDTNWGRRKLDEMSNKALQTGGFQTDPRWGVETKEKCMAIQDIGCTLEYASLWLDLFVVFHHSRRAAMNSWSLWLCLAGNLSRVWTLCVAN